MTEKVVLVTGCARGIGEDICKFFKINGWRVFGVDITEAKHDHCDTSYVLDVSAPVTGDMLLCDIDRLDCLVNNAAKQVCLPVEKTLISDWKSVLDVNLIGPALLSKALLPLLKQTKGSIVNISSIHSLVTSKDIASYSVSKAGLAGLTRVSAIDFAKHGVRVNAVSPGAIDTPMLRAHLSTEEVERMGERHLVGRIGKPEEVAQLVMFLADNEKSGFITGQNIVMDGGASIRLSTEV